MFPTKNSLPEPTRVLLVNLLNQSLADMFTLFSHCKQAHWNLKGPQFISLHLLFDDIAGKTNDFADTIAERAMALGGSVSGTVASAAAKTTLPDYPNVVGCNANLMALSDCVAAVTNSSRANIDTCLALKDNCTADLFTEISRELDKQLWFLEAHLQGSNLV